MASRLIYLFDPLCGWCYGAGSALPSLLASTDLTLYMQPTGLFSGEGARLMDEVFADYAWRNDQRISRLTGREFSTRYREQVLTDHAQSFDSGPVTVALTAVHLSAPEREFDALEAIQRARYVDGCDITRLETLSAILESSGLVDAARRLGAPDNALLTANQMRVGQGRALLEQTGAQGVPTLVVERQGQQHVLSSSALFSNPEALARELRATA
ncbi:DsbA family protein [Larsenimonas suaedae]|uniref:DsbA family protein n=1 Tax=Larsenimonas suaedae TaxID=1851019 RepID=A0ABU1GR86_9GAMM|nr:DsbA family protein [Larsenimonas suaedae]MCM2972699.1 DsbA family protein [Larsenimonas suaedae]MDR5894504.1 DsbA family protein [Larsenimonas suaedae]